MLTKRNWVELIALSTMLSGMLFTYSMVGG